MSNGCLIIQRWQLNYLYRLYEGIPGDQIISNSGNQKVGQGVNGGLTPNIWHNENCKSLWAKIECLENLA